MFRLSNALLTTLNIVFLLFGLGLVGGGIHFHFHGATSCHKFLENSLFILGSASFAVSLLGLIGSCCRNNCLLLLYLVFMLLFIIGVGVLATFIFLVTNPFAGRLVSGLGNEDLRLGDYSHWLKNHVTDEKNWVVIKSCLVDSRVCSSLTNITVVDPEVLKKNLSPLLYGCCERPRGCGYGDKNGTWVSVVAGSDCEKWSNKQNKLCYNCDSCKAGFLSNIRRQWLHLEIFFVCLLIFSMFVLSIGCRARSNNWHHHPSKISFVCLHLCCLPFGTVAYPVTFAKAGFILCYCLFTALFIASFAQWRSRRRQIECQPQQKL